MQHAVERSHVYSMVGRGDCVWAVDRWRPFSFNSGATSPILFASDIYLPETPTVFPAWSRASPLAASGNISGMFKSVLDPWRSFAATARYFSTSTIPRIDILPVHWLLGISINVNLKLRKCLQQITDDEKDVWKHIELVEALRPEYEHSINALESAVDVDTYTCAVHAFDLIENPTYLKIRGFGLGRTFAGAKFVEYVLEHELLTKLANTSQKHGDFVMYFKNNKFEHIGIVNEGNRIISKWGEGLLWEHKIWEVPESYGNEKRFYAQPSTCAGLEMFCAYAETRGFVRPT